MILLIESSGENCAVGLSQNSQLISSKSQFGLNHAENLAFFIQELLNENQIETKDLSAVAISGGPGSYTGLRIGVALAKGICFGANLPLIAINSLENLLFQHKTDLPKSQFYIPMFDARRMEVYMKVFDKDFKAITEIAAEVISENSLADFATKGNVVLFGSGAAKLKELFAKNNYISFIDTAPLGVIGMVQLAQAKFEAFDFEDIAYYEPFYLKEFMVTTAKNPLQ